MVRSLISSGSPMEKQAGYSRAVVEETSEGKWVFVAGTTGYDYSTMIMPDDVAQQTRNCLETISGVLVAADLELKDVVRANYIITNGEDYSTVFDVLGTYLADIRPAATMIIAGLVKSEMKVEIEMTAFRPKN